MITRDAAGLGAVVSLYSGAGGLDLGFFYAGFDSVWANDIDPIAVETYNKLFPGHVALEGELDDQDLPSSGDADLVIGGPPCQGFSVAGKMDPDDPRSRHVMTFLDVVNQLRPRAFVIENVKALAVNKRWESLRAAMMERLDGFQTQLLVLNSAHFGVPQARERMFLIGFRTSTALAIEPTSLQTPTTVREAFGELPAWGEPGNDTICDARITPAKNPVLRRSPYAGMLFNGQGRPLNLDRPASTLPASMGGNRTPIIDQRHLESGSEPWVERYHRHLMDGGDPVRATPPFLRRITVEEAASLQTFPVDMYWAGPRSAQFRQIGNAVPPYLAYAVAKGVRDALRVS